jgi:hypothetical protein
MIERQYRYLAILGRSMITPVVFICIWHGLGVSRNTRDIQLARYLYVIGCLRYGFAYHSIEYDAYISKTHWTQMIYILAMCRV